MSNQALNVALMKSRSKATARCVMIALADSANVFGLSWLPLEAPPWNGANPEKCIVHLANTGTKRQAIRAIQELETLGEIQIRKAQRGQRRHNVYRLRFDVFPLSEIRYEDLPFRLMEPFSDDDLVNLRGDGVSPRTGGPSVTSRGDSDDTSRGDEGSPRGVTLTRARELDPSIDPSELTSESQERDSPVPPNGERAFRLESLRWALTAELGAQPLTRHERGGWETAIADLADVDATAAEVGERCAAYRKLWPSMQLTPLALTRHWSLLGSRVELQAIAPGASLERWLAGVCHLADEDLRVLLLERGIEPGQVDELVTRAAAIAAGQATRQAIEEAA